MSYLFIFYFLSSVSDLAPGQMGIDDMKMLEQKAQQLAAEAELDKPKPKEKILFVRSLGCLFTKKENVVLKNVLVLKKSCFHCFPCRSDTSRSELAELSKQANPDEINIDDEDEDDEDRGPDGMCQTKRNYFLLIF